LTLLEVRDRMKDVKWALSGRHGVFFTVPRDISW